MKIVIDRGSLLKSLGHIQSVVERRNTIPILSNVKIEAADGQIALTATDLDLEIVETLAEAQVVVPGAITTPAHMLHDIVKKLPDGSDVELDSGGEAVRLTLRSGRSKFHLGCLPVEDFPTMGGEDYDCTFTLDALRLREMIDKTRFAISTEETRYYLNGIYLHKSHDEAGDVLRAVATDGHRLARVQMALPDGADALPNAIIPRKAVGELRKLADETDEAITISVSTTRVRADFGNVVITSKLIDGTYPDYERVIPSGNDKLMRLDPRLLDQAVDRVSTIASEKSRAIKLSIGENVVTLSATSSDYGSASEEVEVEYSADMMEVGYNSKYLRDIAGLLEGETAQFAMADAAAPTLISDLSDDTALFVLMPMRV
ncbi:MAG: DNA polymerase III subunit beta [Alphaproteobacteria bacterium]